MRASVNRPSRLGLVLFALYALLYVGFVGLIAFAGDVMEATPIAGVNVAVLYGFGLIGVAVTFAIVSGVFTAAEDESPERGR